MNTQGNPGEQAGGGPSVPKALFCPRVLTIDLENLTGAPERVRLDKAPIPRFLKKGVYADQK